MGLAKKGLSQASNGTGAPAPAPVAKPATQPAPAAPAPVEAPAAAPSDLIDVEGIGPAYEKKLANGGVTSRAELLGADLSALATSSGIGEGLLKKWVSQVQLAQLEGLSDQDAEILVAGGINSVQDLAAAHADILNGTLIAINAEKNLVKEVPSVLQIKNWIEQAKA
ncbi:MAG: DUF4332 domain-containing protein [Blastocatellia bacterium]